MAIDENDRFAAVHVASHLVIGVTTLQEVLVMISVVRDQTCSCDDDLVRVLRREPIMTPLHAPFSSCPASGPGT